MSQIDKVCIKMIDFSHVVPITMDTYPKNNLPVEGEVAKIEIPVGNFNYWPYQILKQAKNFLFGRGLPGDVFYQTKQDS